MTARTKKPAKTARRSKSTRSPETSKDAKDLTAEDAIYQVVRAIPKGKVATYGQLAELAGIPSGHRVAARAMRACPDGLPWYRVVGKKDARRAQIAVQEPDHASLQRSRLRKEGVVFDENGFIPLARSGWLPR